MKKLTILIILEFLTLYFIGKIIDIDFIYIIFIFWIPMLIITVILFYWFRNIYFFRDPSRAVPNKKNIIISPADGRVMYIYKVKEGKVISNKKGEDINIKEITKSDVGNKAGWLIGIYMSPFDVHYNYAPISGNVEFMYHHQTAINLPMVDLWEYINFTLLRKAVNLFTRKFHFENERMTIKFSNSQIKCYVILIADKFVNKITPYFKLNDKLEIGNKISFIERGSQADIFILSEDIKCKVIVGQQVYGKSTILAEY